MKEYRFECSCVSCGDADALQAMIDAGQPITLATMRRHCDLDSWAAIKGYAVGRAKGLHLKDDPIVSYYRSTFKGRPCYYLKWSAIEFIWTRRT